MPLLFFFFFLALPLSAIAILVPQSQDLYEPTLDPNDIQLSTSAPDFEKRGIGSVGERRDKNEQGANLKKTSLRRQDQVFHTRARELQRRCKKLQKGDE